MDLTKHGESKAPTFSGKESNRKIALFEWRSSLLAVIDYQIAKQTPSHSSLFTVVARSVTPGSAPRQVLDANFERLATIAEELDNEVSAWREAQAQPEGRPNRGAQARQRSACVLPAAGGGVAPLPPNGVEPFVVLMEEENHTDEPVLYGVAQPQAPLDGASSRAETVGGGVNGRADGLSHGEEPLGGGHPTDSAATSSWRGASAAESLPPELEDDEVVLEMEAVTESGFKANPEKGRFCYNSVSFIGHTVSAADNITMERQLDKLRVVQAASAPRGVHELRQILGLFSYYYRHKVPDFSRIAFPLTCLLKKGVPFAWGDEQQHAFDALKDGLLAAPHLAMPPEDPKM